MEINKAFVDMDGVLVNFEGPAFKLHGIPAGPFPTQAGWDIVQACNILAPECKMTGSKFWGAFDYKFWATLPKTEICDRLITELVAIFGRDKLCLLTAGSSPQAAAGKVTWIKENLPEFLHKQYLIGTCKRFCAGKDAILIDDADINVNEFRKYNGNAILVPRPWNSLHAVACWPYLVEELSDLPLS